MALLANIYMHYVFDLWANRWRQHEAQGDMVIVRYADDFVVGFEHEADARRFWDALRARLEEFALSLHPDKTRLTRRRSQKDLSLSSSSHVQDNQPTLCCKVGAVCNNTKPLSCAQTKNATVSRPAQSRYSIPACSIAPWRSPSQSMAA